MGSLFDPLYLEKLQLHLSQHEKTELRSTEDSEKEFS